RVCAGGVEKLPDGDSALDPGTDLDEGADPARAGVRLQDPFSGTPRIARGFGIFPFTLSGSSVSHGGRRRRMVDRELWHRARPSDRYSGRTPFPALARAALFRVHLFHRVPGHAGQFKLMGPAPYGEPEYV